MPIHDWTRFVAGTFHDFHQRWIVHITEALNGGLLPNEYYALAEQRTEGPEPDIVTLTRDMSEILVAEPKPDEGGLIAVAEHPPRTEVIEQEDEAECLARKADRIVIRHASGDKVVAIIEVVSPGNKHSAGQARSFVEKLSSLFGRGCHLLIVDLFPPGSFDPRGMHAAFWEDWQGASQGVTSDRLLGVSAYRAARVAAAYFQPLAVGELLPDMPLFLTTEHYINVPLEATYTTTWRGVPQRWKAILEDHPTGR